MVVGQQQRLPEEALHLMILVAVVKLRADKLVATGYMSIWLLVQCLFFVKLLAGMLVAIH